MLIKALCDYSDMLSEKTDAPVSDSLSMQKISYLIYLRPDGSISEIADIREEHTETLKNGKTKTFINPVATLMPKRSQKTCIDANVAEHRPLYIFGISRDSEKNGKALKSHTAFVKKTVEFCGDIDSEIVKAYVKFAENWNPENEMNNPILLSIEKDYESSYYGFALDGHPELLLHKDKMLLEKWENEFTDDVDDSEKSKAFCPIEGKELPVARIHEKITGVAGASTFGSAMVCIKENAFESYGKTQSYNSNISEAAMLKYTKALNKLLADKHHKIVLQNMTVVFFALSKTDEKECDLLSQMLCGDSKAELDASLRSVMNEAIKGRVGALNEIGLDENSDFYILGLTPNATRISQKFIMHDKFGNIINNLAVHQRDIAVSENGEQVYFGALLNELKSPKSDNDSVPPPLISAIFNAVLCGTRYPEALLSTVVRRIKTDSNDEKSKFIKINDTRIGIIKGCLNRKARFNNKKEEFSMSLDLGNTNPAYLCGRLFALLEFIQQRASGGTLNSTIKDRFFSSACSRPAVVFPRLLVLAQNHIGKLENEGYWTKAIGDIVSELGNVFPTTLMLDEQGSFIIGYYQQNKLLYTKKEENKD